MKGFVKRCISYRNGASAAVYFDFGNRKRKKKSLVLAPAAPCPPSLGYPEPESEPGMSRTVLKAAAVKWP